MGAAFRGRSFDCPEAYLSYGMVSQKKKLVSLVAHHMVCG